MSLRETVLVAVLAVVIAFEAMLFFVSILSPDWAASPEGVANTNFYRLASPLAPVLLMIFLYNWVFRVLCREAQRYGSLRKVGSSLFGVFAGLLIARRRFSPDISTGVRMLSYPGVALAIAVTSGFLLGLLPYRSHLGSAGPLVGVDSSDYVAWTQIMLARRFDQALAYAFVGGLEGSRPALLIPLYLVASVGIPPAMIVQFLPAVLAPLLSLSSYLFVRVGQGSSRFAGLTSLFTSFSFYTTIGIWGGYYANWLALSETFLLLTSLLRFSRSPSSRGVMVMLTLGLVLFLTHPWTWTLAVSTCVVFAITIWWETRQLFHVTAVAGVVVSGVVMDFLKSWVFETRSLVSDVATKIPSGGIVQPLFGFWSRIVDSLFNLHSGLMANSIILGLCVVGSLLLRFGDRFQRMLMVWTAISSVPILVVDSYHQARIIYNLPTALLTSLAVAFMVERAAPEKAAKAGLVLLPLLVAANYALEVILPL